MMTRRVTTLLSIVLLAASGAVGCGGVSFDGENDNVDYDSPTGYWGTEVPELAVGARLQFSGRKTTTSDGVTTSRDVEFTKVTSSKPEVIEVVESMGEQFVLEAKTAGKATIETVGTVEDEETTDSFEIRASEVKKVEFETKCPEVDTLTDEGEQSARPFLAGTAVDVGFEMYDGSGDRLSGYGHYPVKLAGSGGSLDTSVEQSGQLRVTLPDSPGTFAVEAKTGSGKLEFDVIGKDAIDEVLWGERELFVKTAGEPKGNQSGHFVTLKAGETSYVHPVFKSGGNYVCQAAAPLKLSVQTPDVCQPSYHSKPPEDDPVQGLFEVSSAVSIEAQKSGTCEFTATIEGPKMPASGSFEQTVEAAEE